MFRISALIDEINQSSIMFLCFSYLFCSVKKKSDDEGDWRGCREEEGCKVEGESNAAVDEGPTRGKCESLALCVLGPSSPSCISIMLIHLQQGPLGNISLTCDYANSLLFAH